MSFQNNAIFGLTVTGNTIYSGSTDISNIFLTNSQLTNSLTHIQPGSNIYTGGTTLNPTVNLSALTISTIVVSGNSSFTTLSATTINVSALTLSTVIASGNSNFTILSATTISGGTIYSGSTNLYSIFAPVGIQTGSNIQNGTNTFTAGTNTSQSVNVTALTISYIVVTGTTISRAGIFSATTFTANTITATTISGATIYSGSTNLYSIFDPLRTVATGAEVTAGANNFKIVTPASLTASTSIQNAINAGKIYLYNNFS